MIFQKKWKNVNPSKWCSRCRKTTFSEKCECRKNKNTSNNERPKNTTNRGFGIILGGQKSSQIMTFWKHENIDLDMLFQEVREPNREPWTEPKSQRFRSNRSLNRTGAETVSFKPVWNRTGWTGNQLNWEPAEPEVEPNQAVREPVWAQRRFLNWYLYYSGSRTSSGRPALQSSKESVIWLKIEPMKASEAVMQWSVIRKTSSII